MCIFLFVFVGASGVGRGGEIIQAVEGTADGKAMRLEFAYCFRDSMEANVLGNRIVGEDVRERKVHRSFRPWQRLWLLARVVQGAKQRNDLRRSEKNSHVGAALEINCMASKVRKTGTRWVVMTKCWPNMMLDWTRVMAVEVADRG